MDKMEIVSFPEVDLPLEDGNNGHKRRLASALIIRRLGVRVPPGVPNPNTREQPDDVGLFLSELRFESQVHKSHVRELVGHKHAPRIDP